MTVMAQAKTVNVDSVEAEVWALVLEDAATCMVAHLCAPDDDRPDPAPLSEARRARARETLQALVRVKVRAGKVPQMTGERYSSDRERGAAIVRFIATLCGWAQS